MKTFASAIALAFIVLLFIPGPGSASPLKRLSFQQPELYLGNPSAPELYSGLVKVFSLAQQEALSRLLPPRKENVIAAPSELDTVSKPGNI